MCSVLLYIYYYKQRRMFSDKLKKLRKMKNSISKSKVMKAAWTIFRKEGVRTMEAWSKALTRAWAWAKKTFPSQPQGISGFHVVRETDKAICVAASLVCYVTDQSTRSNVWVPKSI